ncbi:serine protease inhibitor-like [Rhipicephalus sanguineus]|uniref:serine protease inhibitor-like n=1 Tax=Rhipicephalus sanguineus TaxID=34632 RepID=UPI0018935B6F|nr:serine protease inhibitor-like [Rhipicephalus sanguineus]
MGLGNSSVAANQNAPPAPHQRRPAFEAASAILEALGEAPAKKPEVLHRASLPTSSSSDESLSLECSASPHVEARISAGILGLGLEILLALRRSGIVGQGNLIFSPYAIASTMAALLSDPSANTVTAKQVAHLLHISSLDESVTAYFARRDRVVPRCRNDNVHSFDMAYQVVVHYNYHRVGNEDDDDDDARASAPTTARASRMPWDFKREPESSRADADHHARCYAPSFAPDEILPPGTVTDSTLVLLLSVIDFDGTWKYPLDAKAAGQGFFYESPCAPITVGTIRQTGRLRVFDATKNLGAMVVEVPYQGPKGTFSLHTKDKNPKIALILFIPTVMDGLEELERRLNVANVSDALSNLREVDDVEITLPLFRAKQVIDLKDTLSSLGFDAWYTDELQPLHASEPGPHAVSAARHASAFRVCTKGGAAQVTKTKPPKGKAAAGRRYTVDRPFLFMVTCSDPDAMLLLGSVKRIYW